MDPNGPSSIFHSKKAYITREWPTNMEDDLQAAWSEPLSLKWQPSDVPRDPAKVPLPFGRSNVAVAMSTPPLTIFPDETPYLYSDRRLPHLTTKGYSTSRCFKKKKYWLHIPQFWTFSTLIGRSFVCRTSGWRMDKACKNDAILRLRRSFSSIFSN